MRILQGDCRDVLPTLPDESVHCCVTSPPYWGLRNYGVVGQIGLEPTFAEYIETMRAVFAQVWRVLRKDGTLWLNLGDSYASAWVCNRRSVVGNGKRDNRPNRLVDGLKEKDLCGIPWRVAFALQADGWYLRSDIIWSKCNPMPESVTDRPTKAHEYLFLLSKSDRYFYDAEAIAEPVVADEQTQRIKNKTRNEQRGKGDQDGIWHARGKAAPFNNWKPTRNRRTVWEIPTAPFPEAHFAMFPPALVEPCILAGCPLGGTVLDPFGGAGTVGLVADRFGRDAVMIELNGAYVEIAERRLRDDAGMFAEISTVHMSPKSPIT
jgi:DNA modification methylase